MKKDEIVIELHKSANENGLLPTLYAVFGKSAKVIVPFSKKACDTEIDAIDFSVRALNALKRAGLFTIGDVIDSIAREELSKIRNLGKKTVNEIQTQILMFGYNKLNEREKVDFFFEILENNCKKGS
jgi:DNA-directed RNA polymerase alpha subunit